MDPGVANDALEKLLAEDAVLIGPLWPAPGAGRWDGRELTPAFVLTAVLVGEREVDRDRERGRAPAREVVAVRVLVVHERARELVFVGAFDHARVADERRRSPISTVQRGDATMLRTQSARSRPPDIM